jgi:hypothetical protein
MTNILEISINKLNLLTLILEIHAQLPKEIAKISMRLLISLTNAPLPKFLKIYYLSITVLNLKIEAGRLELLIFRVAIVLLDLLVQQLRQVLDPPLVDRKRRLLSG